MTRFKDIVQHIVEYCLSAIFLLAAYGEVVYSEAPVQGVLGVLFSDPIATYVYAVWFTLMALSLIVSKWFRQKRLHKHVLAAMYLTTIYTISLAVAVFGFAGGAVIDDGIIGAAAAICWLRWKFKTEYLSPKQFEKMVKDLP